MSLNKRVEEYLDYYCDLEEPSYAVLLKGQWGCGKSHFISCYKNKNLSKKFIYVSLYGLKETSQIDDALFQSANPRLGSKSVGVISKIAASSLQAATTLDLSNGRAYFRKLATKMKDCILIFDDLERCEIALQEIFGYINDFVEHEKRHVIMIADASKIESSKYQEIKEKLIGQELEIKLDIEGALDTFCNSVKVEGCKSFLIKSCFYIQLNYAVSTFNNLRTLKKVIYDFELIYNALPNKALKKEKLLEDILKTLLVLSLEVRGGSIKNNDIEALFQVNLYLEGKKENDSSFVQIRKKYSLPYSPILGSDFWETFFSTGFFNEQKLSEGVGNSSYFQDENMPDWMKLWHGLDVSDKEFEHRKQQVLVSLEKKEYTDEPVILHVFGLFLWMSKNGLYSTPSSEILEEFKKYIDGLVNDESLIFIEEERGHNLGAHYSLSYFGREEKEFNELCEHFNEKRQYLTENKLLPEQAKELLQIMVEDARKFEQILVLSNSDEQKYYNIPILCYLAPEDFVNSLNDTTDQRTVGSALQRRYEFTNFNELLLDELPWLKEVKNLLRTEIKKRNGKISGWRYKGILKAIDDAIEKLEALSDMND